jgi:hypothetical protein
MFLQHSMRVEIVYTGKCKKQKFFQALVVSKTGRLNEPIEVLSNPDFVLIQSIQLKRELVYAIESCVWI